VGSAKSHLEAIPVVRDIKEVRIYRERPKGEEIDNRQPTTDNDGRTGRQGADITTAKVQRSQ
jgi:hypothetical protein